LGRSPATDFLRRNGVSQALTGLQAYLRDTFDRTSSHPQSRLAELLPDQWQAAHFAVDGKEGG
jgi:hypothetical protein